MILSSLRKDMFQIIAYACGIWGAPHLRERSFFCCEMVSFILSSLREVSIGLHLSYTRTDTCHPSRGTHNKDHNHHGQITKGEPVHASSPPVLLQHWQSDYSLRVQILFHMRDKSTRSGCDGVHQGL